MELIKVRHVSHSVYKKPKDVKMSDWASFWKDRVDELDKVQKYPASYAGSSPYKNASEEEMEKYVDCGEDSGGEDLVLSIEFTSDEANSIADPAYGFMSDILNNINNKSNHRKTKI